MVMILYTNILGRGVAKTPVNIEGEELHNSS